MVYILEGKILVHMSTMSGMSRHCQDHRWAIIMDGLVRAVCPPASSNTCSCHPAPESASQGSCSQCIYNQHDGKPAGGIQAANVRARAEGVPRQEGAAGLAALPRDMPLQLRGNPLRGPQGGAPSAVRHAPGSGAGAGEPDPVGAGGLGQRPRGLHRDSHRPEALGHASRNREEGTGPAAGLLHANPCQAGDLKGARNGGGRSPGELPPR
jgi:hypothetical protein